MSAVSVEAWRAFIDSRPEAHLLQSAEWGELKAAFGWRARRLIVGEVGAQVLFRPLPLGFSVGYLPKPAFGDRAPAAGNPFWTALDQLCRQERAVFLKIEPDRWQGEPDDLEPGLAGPSPHAIQPPRTIVVDLRGGEEEVLARMKQKCRYNVRLAEKKGVTVRPVEDVAAFHRMMLVTGGRDGFGVHAEAYYRQAYALFRPRGACELLAAEYDGRPLAMLMVFACGRRAYYLFGASGDEERNRMPAYLLQWEAMRWARARGAESYDLWGVPDEDEQTLEAQFEQRQDGLWGVYRFKRGFGGELKRAQQARDRVFQPLLYRLYLRRYAGRE